MHLDRRVPFSQATGRHDCRGNCSGMSQKNAKYQESHFRLFLGGRSQDLSETACCLMNNSEYLTVSGLNRFIKDVLNAGFPQPVWVCGEIQQYDRNKGKKHIFFELVEKDSRSDEILARVGLVIFANRKTAIDQILVQSENAFALKDDIEVKFRCTVDFYPPHGAVRLIVEEIDPTYTLGKLAQEKQKLIAALKEKGVLDKKKQLPLPPVPLTIGLITSDDSAAYNDFISELRKSGYGFKVYLRNTLMQGKNAPKDVCRALAELQRLDGLEAIIIPRGGGSLAELSCFTTRRTPERAAPCLGRA